MSGNFRLSYATISGFFLCHAHPKFPGRLSCSTISGLFRLSPVLAGHKEFDPGPRSLETETQQYVLLGTTISAQ